MATKKINTDLQLTAKLLDGSGSAGTSGQILSSTGTATDWISLSEISGVDGTGTANYIAKWSDTDTITNSVIYDNGTNVGIGTTNPTSDLHISDSFPRITLQDSDSTNTLSYIDQDSSYLNLIARNGSNYGNIRFRRYDGTTTATSMIIQADGNITMTGNLTLSYAYPRINLTDTDNDSDYSIINNDGSFSIYDVTNSSHRLSILASGNVGIGNPNPSYLLDVNEDDNAVAFRVTGGGGGAAMASFVRDVGSTGASVNINAQSNFPQIQFVSTGNTFSIGADSSGNFKISDNTSIGTNDRITIDNIGRVGIGTTTPNQRLTINGTDQYVATEQTNYVWGGTTTLGVRMGTDATAGLLDFRRWTGTGTTHGTALITQVNSDGGYGLDFRVNTQSTNTVATTSRMFLSTSGEVGIGTTSPGYKLDVNGGAQFNTNTGSTPFYITRLGSATEALSIKVMDDNVRFESIQDESADSYGGFDFRMDGGVTEPNFVIRKNADDPILHVDGSGNVGIGTTSPLAKLDISDTADEVDLTSATNFAINTGGLIASRHYKNVNLETPEFEWSIGGSTDLNWKKLATIVISDANYSGFGAEVEITDFSGNYGSSLAEYGDVYRGGLSIYHQGGTGVAPKEGIITIHNDMIPYIRIYKIAGSGNSSYEIQVKSPANFRQLYVKLKGGIGNQVADIFSHANDTNGSTSGGTAYTPDAYTSGNQFKTGFTTVTANRGNILDKFGIGTTSPSEKLSIAGGNLLIAGDYQSLYVGGKTDSSQDGLRMSIDNAGNGYIDHRGSGNLNFRADGLVGAATRMVITSGGNVGIGTTSPSEKLHVVGNIKTSGQVIVGPNTQSGSNQAAASFITENDVTIGGAINWWSEVQNGSFGTYNHAVFYHGATQAGSIQRTGNSTVSYNTSSDYRLKENVIEIADGIERVKQLKPSKFNFIGEERIVDGFLAHEVQNVVPESISGEKDEVDAEGNPIYQAIDQSKIVPLLAAALKEAIIKIENLETKIQILENQ